MRIAVVIPKYGLVGGAEGFAYELTERLALHAEFDLHVFANRWRAGQPAITFHKVTILPFPRFLRQISFAFFSNKLIGKRDFNLIHSHDRIFQMDLLTMHGIPHRTWIREVRQKRLTLFDKSVAWVEGKGLRGSPLPTVLPVSGLVRDELLKLYNLSQQRVRVMHPGVSTEGFSALDRDQCRHEIRRRHGLHRNDVVILFVGMNFEIKRLGAVIEGMAHAAKVEKGSSGLKLLVVGKGREKPYRNLAHRLGVADRLVFAGVSNEVEKYYMASDIFAMPSRFDTFGMAVLEAMTAGLPVIITKNVGAKDLVTHEVAGFVLGEENLPTDLGESFAFLLKEENRRRMGTEARKVAGVHSWDHVADQVADLYWEIGRRI